MQRKEEMNFDKLNEVTKMVAKQLFRAITHLHHHGICHRDIKPDNIVLSEDYSKLKIIDFNTAVKFKT